MISHPRNSFRKPTSVFIAFIREKPFLFWGGGVGGDNAKEQIFKSSKNYNSCRGQRYNANNAEVPLKIIKSYWENKLNYHILKEPASLPQQSYDFKTAPLSAVPVSPTHIPLPLPIQIKALFSILGRFPSLVSQSYFILEGHIKFSSLFQEKEIPPPPKKKDTKHQLHTMINYLQQHLASQQSMISLLLTKHTEVVCHETWA